MAAKPFQRRPHSSSIARKLSVALRRRRIPVAHHGATAHDAILAHIRIQVGRAACRQHQRAAHTERPDRRAAQHVAQRAGPARLLPPDREGRSQAPGLAQEAGGHAPARDWRQAVRRWAGDHDAHWLCKADCWQTSGSSAFCGSCPTTTCCTSTSRPRQMARSRRSRTTLAADTTGRMPICTATPRAPRSASGAPSSSSPTCSGCAPTRTAPQSTAPARCARQRATWRSPSPRPRPSKSRQCHSSARTAPVELCRTPTTLIILTTPTISSAATPLYKYLHADPRRQRRCRAPLSSQLHLSPLRCPLPARRRSVPLPLYSRRFSPSHGHSSNRQISRTTSFSVAPARWCGSFGPRHRPGVLGSW